MTPPLPPQTAVIFTYGGAVFACNDSTWHDILKEVAEFNGRDLIRIVQNRSQRLSDRPLIHLGLLEPEEARIRLATRNRALKGTPDAAPPVLRQRFLPPEKVAQKSTE